MTTIVQLSDTPITAPGRLAYGRVDTHDALPGNHDRRDAMRRAFVDAAYLPIAEGPLGYVASIGDLRVVALDAAVPGAPHGRLEDGRLDWLDAALAEPPSTPTLVFTHRPPFETGVGHIDAQRLLNGEALLDRLKRHAQIRLVASGHMHRAIVAAVDGLACAIAPSRAHAGRLDATPRAAPAFDLEPGAVLAHVWRAGRLVSHVSYVDRFPGPYPFFGDDDQLIT